MRTETIVRVLYTVEELQEQHPRGFDRAHSDYSQDEYAWADHSDEWASLREFDRVVGFTRGYRGDVWGGLSDHAELTGRRAWAWLENEVLADYRLPWKPITGSATYSAERRKNAKYRQRPGTIPPCPFTGYYTDEVILDEVRECLRSGGTVYDAVLGLEAAIQREVDRDLEYRTSEEGFIEWAANNDVEFTEAGERA